MELVNAQFIGQIASALDVARVESLLFSTETRRAQIQGQRQVLEQAIEILLNTPTVAELLSKGQSAAIKPVMDKSRELGMQTFDQALFDLYDAGHISYEEAIRNADSTNELRLAIKLRSRKGEPSSTSGMSLTIEVDKAPEPVPGEEAGSA